MHSAKSPRWRQNDKTKWAGQNIFLPYKKLKQESTRFSNDKKLSDPYTGAVNAGFSPTKQIDARLGVSSQSQKRLKQQLLSNQASGVAYGA